MSSRAKRGISEKLERLPELRCVIYHPARDPSSSARLRMTRELFLRLFRPRVPQRDRAIPHLFFSCGIRLEREVAEALDLKSPLASGSGTVNSRSYNRMSASIAWTALTQ